MQTRELSFMYNCEASNVPYTCDQTGYQIRMKIYKDLYIASIPQI